MPANRNPRLAGSRQGEASPAGTNVAHDSPYSQTSPASANVAHDSPYSQTSPASANVAHDSPYSQASPAGTNVAHDSPYSQASPAGANVAHDSPYSQASPTSANVAHDSPYSQAPPPGGMGAALAAGTALGIGTYQYAVTFLTPGGETTSSPLVSITTTSGNQQVNLSAIPVGPPATTTPGAAINTVTGRNLYRTQLNGAQLFLLATLANNTSTTYSDSSADSQLTNRPPAPGVNTSGVMFWPPYEREFAEYSNLFDSSSALAAGGNLGLQGGVGDALSPESAQTQSFTLKLSAAELPQDNTLVMRVFYATKHQLDSSGSTIPDVHRDIIVLGASAYAMQAYQVPTNDNFDFQDGTLRDRIDDTSIPQSWLAATRARLQQFETRLTEIRNQRDFASSSRVHWGDIAYRWPRL